MAHRRNPGAALARRAFRRLVPALALAAAIGATGDSFALSPRTGDMSIAFAVGQDGTVGGGDDFHSDTVVALSWEMQWTAAKSVRATMGSLDLPARDGSDRGNVSGIYLTGNFSYNWFRKTVFPYLTGGVGIYAMEERTGPAEDDDDIEAGLNAGGGIEFRLHDVVTLRLEGLVHAITGNGPRTVAIGTFGVKFYF